MINRIGILAHALSSRMTPRRDQDAWIRKTKPLERQFRAVAVLSVAACTTATAGVLDVGSVAKGLLKGDGFELTRAHDLIRLPGAPLRNHYQGDVLARLPGAPAWFTSTWSALRFERERAWWARRHSSGNPAEIMGLWGLGAIESLVTNAQAQPGDAPEMWRAVERAFREARLVEPRLGRDFWATSCRAPLRVVATGLHGSSRPGRSFGSRVAKSYRARWSACALRGDQRGLHGGDRQLAAGRSFHINVG